MHHHSVKFTPYRVPDNALPRQRLLDKLGRHRHARLVVIHAPAGYGKTTLVGQYIKQLKQQNTPAGWLTLDPQDNDIQRFSSVMQQLYRLHIRSKDGPRPGDAAEAMWEWMLSSMADASLPDVCVMDDFEHITDSTVLSTLASALSHLPQGRQLIVCSRTFPELKVSKLALTDELLVIGPDDLRFNRKECDHYMDDNLTDTKLEPSQKETLYQNTQGWPAILKLSSIVLNSESQADSFLALRPVQDHNLMVDYFQENVLDRLPEEIKEFLGLTSCLERFNLPLCNAVTESEDAQACIDYLKGRGLFIASVDDDGTWFSYQKVFQQFLYRQFKQRHPDQVSSAHFRACQWLLEHGKPDLAISHAIKAERMNLAAQLLDKYALDYLDASRIHSLRRWASHLSERQLTENKRLMLALYWTAVLCRDREQADDLSAKLDLAKAEGTLPSEYHIQLDMLKVVRNLLMDRIPEGAKRLENMARFYSDARGWVNSGLLNIHIFYAIITNQYQALRQYIQEARALDGPHYTTSYLYAFHAISLLQQGEILEAKETLLTGKQKLSTCENDHYAARYQLLPLFANCLYEMGQVDEADTILTESLPLIRDVALADWLSMAYLTLSRIRCHQGQPDKAIKYLEELERIGYCESMTRVVCCARWEMVRVLLEKGEIVRAEEMIMAIRGEGLISGDHNYQFHPGDIEADDIGYLRFLLASAQYDQALEQANVLIRSTNECRKFRLLKINLMKAVAQRGAGYRRDALRTLAATLREGSSKGLFRSVLDEGDRLLNLVEELRQTNLNEAFSPNYRELDAYCQRLLKASGRFNKVMGKVVVQPESDLTARELQLLQLAHDGHANKVIAARLSLTENTVKWHLRNAYAKLGVKKRTQAIAVGRELGLIH